MGQPKQIQCPPVYNRYQVVQDGPPPPLLLKMGLEESASDAVDKRVFERGRVADLKQTKAAKALSKL